MTSIPDYYALLGVSRDADEAEVRRAYRRAAMRLHPDVNLNPGDTEFFLEVTRGYEILSNPELRSAYDERLTAAEADLSAKCSFRYRVLHSRQNLLVLDEPQVHYLLIDIFPAEDIAEIRPIINLAIIIDRSTSMADERLDQVRAASLAIMKMLEPRDTATILAFSDRAEVVLSPEETWKETLARARLSLLQAGGGTEIGQGLRAGLEALERYFSPDGVNHIILLTDGRTYGDEEACLAMADKAAKRGITINAVGIGSEWSDRFLDDLASRTGGNVIFLGRPRAIQDLLTGIFDSLGRVAANRVRLSGSFSEEIELRSAFRLLPDPMPLSDSLPLNLGHLPMDREIRLLIELIIQPIRGPGILNLGNLSIQGDVLSHAIHNQTLPLTLSLEASSVTGPEPPPPEIVRALGAIALYRIQEKARHEAEFGQPSQAARRLETLATHLLAGHEKGLAHTALREAERLTKSLNLSPEGEKALKYGTRALLLPASMEKP